MRSLVPRINRKQILSALLALPAVLWLLLFYVIPLVCNLSTSLQTGSLEVGYHITWNFHIFLEVFQRFNRQFFHSIIYAAISTGLCFLLGFPLVYLIVFRLTRFRYLLLSLIIAPFFTSLLIRIIAWKTILADDGVVIHMGEKTHLLDLLHILGITDSSHSVLSSPCAVVLGLTYNFLPFMILPLYTSLSKIDPVIVQAAYDLYGTSWSVARTILFPLALPGIISGTLLTFIPACGDYINSHLLGSSNTQMIGNVIQNEYLVTLNYPMAAAVSIIFLLLILILVTCYLSLSKVEDLW